MEKLISIVIPTFNRKEYLNLTIESLKNKLSEILKKLN